MFNFFQSPWLSRLINSWPLRGLLGGSAESPCVTWGNSASENTKVEWTTWKYKESSTEARNAGAWGELQLLPSDSFVSSVVDTGTYKTQKLTITENIAKGSGSIYYRFSSTSFAQSDVLPTWTLYSAPVIDTFRYYQIRADA